MKLTVLFVFSIFISNSISAKLLDKISGIVDDNVITLSQIQRMSKSLAIKKNIAPMIYDKASFTNEEFLTMTVNKFLIRSKLNELGFPVGDDQVEAQVHANEKRLNVNREQLKTFLKTQNTTYDEYFEALREAMEYSYYVSRIITPLISISEQEIKNDFIKKNSKDARLNIKYSLIDYSIPKEDKPKLDQADFENSVKMFKQNSITPSSYSNLTSNNLDEIAEEGLAPELRNTLKTTNEGAFSKTVFFNNQYHVFFIVKKDLVETENFIKQKDKIKEDLYEAAVKVEVAVWFEREKHKHYIKLSL